MNDSTPIIDDARFRAYTLAWEALLQAADPAALTACLSPDQAGLSPGAFLPFLELMRLVSTVGATHVRARFGLEESPALPPRFVVLLFASDEAGEPLSAYYVARLRAPSPALTATEPVPDVLAQWWRTAWQQTKEASAALFAGPYGPLRGYTFRLRDFMDTLFAAPEISGEAVLLLDFALHEYYRPGDPAQALQHTFGLVLQLRPAGGAPTLLEPFYDVSMPCPKTC